MEQFFLSSWELTALSNSVVIALVVSISSLILASGFALHLAFSTVPARRMISTVLFLPIFIPPYLLTFAWMHTLWFLEWKFFSLSMRWELAAMLRTMPGVMLILTLSFFPIAFFLISQAIRSIPQEHLDAAALSTSPMRVLARIILPLLLPAFSVSFLLTFIVAFTTFDVPALLDTDVLLMHIFKLFSFQQDIGRAIYLSAIPMVCIGILWSFVILFQKRKAFFTTQPVMSAEFSVYQRPGTLQSVIFWVIATIMISISLLPIIFLPTRISFFETNPYTGSVIMVMSDTVRLSLVSSIAIVAGSIPVFLFVYRHFLGRVLLLSLLVVPSITFGIVFIRIFNTPPLQFIYTTPLILVIAYWLRFAPVVCEIFYTHTMHTNPELLQSARMVVPMSRKMITAILAPIYKPVLFLAWAFSFWFVITELPMTLLLQPAGFQTIASRLYILLHLGAEETVSVLTFGVMLLSILFIFGVRYFFRIDHD